MEEVNLVKEIERLESMYIHYRKLYRSVRFLCCSSETKRLKERKKYFKSHLQETKRTKEYSDSVKKTSSSYNSCQCLISFDIFS